MHLDLCIIANARTELRMGIEKSASGKLNRKSRITGKPEVAAKVCQSSGFADHQTATISANTEIGNLSEDVRTQ